MRRASALVQSDASSLSENGALAPFRGAKSQFEPPYPFWVLRAPRTRSLKGFLSDLRVLRGEESDADQVLRQPARERRLRDSIAEDSARRRREGKATPNFRSSHKKVNFSPNATKKNRSFCLPNYAILCNQEIASPWRLSATRRNDILMAAIHQIPESPSTRPRRDWRWSGCVSGSRFQAAYPG